MQLSRALIKKVKHVSFPVRAFSGDSSKNVIIQNDGKEELISHINNIWDHYPKMHKSYTCGEIYRFKEDFESEKPCDKSKEILKFLIDQDIKNDDNSRKLNLLPASFIGTNGIALLYLSQCIEYPFLTSIMTAIATGNIISLPFIAYVDSNKTMFRKDAINVINETYYDNKHLVYFTA